MVASRSCAYLRYSVSVFMFFIVVMLLSCANKCGATAVKSFKIGALIDKIGPEAQHKERALHLALAQLNSNSSLHQLQPSIRHIAPDDPLEAHEAACTLIKEGAVAILGPSGDHNFLMTQSICDEKDVPLLDVRWWVDEPRTTVGPTINFHPHYHVLNRLYWDLVMANWPELDTLVVLYEDEVSLRRVAGFLESNEPGDLGRVLIRQLGVDGNYRPVLREVWRSKASHIVVDCSIGALGDVLQQAQQVGLVSDERFFLITNPDLHTLDLSAFQYAGTNITGIRLYDPENDTIKHLAVQLYADEIQSDPMFIFKAPWKLQLETVLVVDAVMMFGEVLSELSQNMDVAAPAVECRQSERWVLGSTINNLLKGMQYFGYSGLLKFDVRGHRTNFATEILELMEGGITKVGTWTDGIRQDKLLINRPISADASKISTQSLKNEHLRVVISLVEPFASNTPTSEPLDGNSRYQGFAVDLIHELSLTEGFSYTFINQEDKKNGDFKPELGKWDGMIGAILDDVADLAIADLTITSDRQKAVEFTTPFMNLGISILYQKPRKAAPGFFSFADPFALEVWMLVAVSFFTVSIILFVLGRICSSEWDNPYPCIENPEFLVNQLSLRNCFWFTSGAIMQQGSEIGPVAVSTRLVATMWWFFTLIMVSSYTANLAVFLTTEKPQPHFTDIFGLLKNSKKYSISWGAKEGGSTAKFFDQTRDLVPEYGQIYDYMQAHRKEVLVDDPEKGVEKAEKGQFAFFMESTSIEYHVQRRCNLTAVGGLLDEKSYGIAMKLSENDLNRAILDLQNSGKLKDLQRKWWEEKRGGGFCTAAEGGGGAQALTLRNVGGVFWVTIGGVLLAILLVFVEMIMHVVKRSLKSKIPLKTSLMQEMKFYFRFSGMVKPVIYFGRHQEEEQSEHGNDGEQISNGE